MDNLYLVTNKTIGYLGSGEHQDVLLNQHDILYTDETTTFDENSMEFKRLSDNQFVILNRFKRFFGLPKNIIKYYKGKD